MRRKIERIEFFWIIIAPDIKVASDVFRREHV